MKKEKYDYFNEFIKLSDNIVKSANILKQNIENFDFKKLDSNINELHHLENESDEIIHQMRNYLIKDFLPPIDREDIAQIGNKLDDIEDGIDEILINIKILDITEIKPEVKELVNVLVICCEAVMAIFTNFTNLKNKNLIREKVVQVNKLEEQGDRTYEKLMTLLYKEEKDVTQVIKWTNIYNDLEDTIDACERLGDCIEDVVMKNS